MIGILAAIFLTMLIVVYLYVAVVSVSALYHVSMHPKRDLALAIGAVAGILCILVFLVPR